MQKQTNKLQELFSKTAAVAIARGGDLQNILQLDNEIMKHFNDCLFYKHTMKNSKSETARFVVENLYEISSR